MSAVVAQHCGLLPFGWTGVWLFFVISGYVVTLTVINRPSDGFPSARLAGFLRRRAARIVPVYYLYVLVGIAVAIGTGVTLDGYALASLSGFFHNVAMGQQRGDLGEWPVGHLWTISVEMQFYLLYGPLLIFAPRRVVLLLLIAALVVTPAARLITSLRLEGLGLEAELSAYRIYSGSLLHTDVFAAGALLAFASQAGCLRRLSRPLALSGVVALLLYCVSYVWLNWSIGNAQGLDVLRNVVSGILWGQHREVAVYSALAAASSGLVALAATNDRWTSWLLRHRLLQRIGEVSYGAYIFHVLAIVVSARVLSYLFGVSDHSVGSRLALFAVSYVLTVAAAELSFRRFETRFTRKKISAARQTTSGGVAVTPGRAPMHEIVAGTKGKSGHGA